MDQLIPEDEQKIIKSIGGQIHNQMDGFILNDNYKVHIVDGST